MLGSVKLAGHRAAGLAAAVAVAGAAAGCASTGASPSRPAAASSVAAASSAASSAAVVSSSAAPSSSAVSVSVTPSPVASPSVSVPVTAACPTRYLAAKVGLGQGSAGSVYQVIDFTNVSSAPCTLYGYPGVSLAAGSPVTQVGAAASRSAAASAAVITLAPGATANALLRITQAQNYPSASCSPAATTYLQIYPPDQYTPIYLAYKTTGCAKNAVKLLSIGVITPGSGG